ncbi:uncharacterized protein MONBRDRAFT_25796 [Monosiga brevicollis MX1]|uniref:TLC domain-containing protein n=1 Tax=Monosiga brevicollis TaxID=81824 RepID=A9V0G5_MONBE|nr:uncharacterized protein MONBRDRAFT_25796 [Monosiga brevicollis MX1]EDQ89151.1 predicted protein [Monosiga brevicollis MX1]|eukprot:XP_001746256.1 hypothetical protein [Monosiga brevicollis MX1]
MATVANTTAAVPPHMIPQAGARAVNAYPDSFGMWEATIFLGILILIKLMEAILPKIWPEYKVLSIRHRRNVITYCVEMIVTTIMFIIQMATIQVVIDPDALAYDDLRRKSHLLEDGLLAPLVALYIVELVYRPQTGYELWTHHAITILLSMLAIFTVRDDQQLYPLRMGWVVALTATTEQFVFYALGMRVVRMSYEEAILKATALDALDGQDEADTDPGQQIDEYLQVGHAEQPSLLASSLMTTPTDEESSQPHTVIDEADIDAESEAQASPSKSPPQLRPANSRSRLTRAGEDEEEGPKLLPTTTNTTEGVQHPSRQLQAEMRRSDFIVQLNADQEENRHLTQRQEQIHAHRTRLIAVLRREATTFKVASVATLLCKSTSGIGAFVLLAQIDPWNIPGNWSEFWTIFFCLANICLLGVQFYAARIVWLLGNRSDKLRYRYEVSHYYTPGPSREGGEAVVVEQS